MDPRTLDPRYLDSRYVFGLNGFENQLYPYYWGPSFGTFVVPPPPGQAPGIQPQPPAPSYAAPTPTYDPYAPPTPTYDPYAPPAPSPSSPYAPDATAMPGSPASMTPSSVAPSFFLAASPLTRPSPSSAARPPASPSPSGAARPAAPSGGLARVRPPSTAGCASCGALPPRTSGLSASPLSTGIPALGHGEPYGGPMSMPGIGDLGGMVRRLAQPGQVTADASTFLPSSQGGAGWARVSGAFPAGVGAMALPSPRSERRRGVVPPGVFGPLLSPPPLPRFLPR